MMGGSKENRHTPGLEHWSIAVKDGKALENQWRTEIPIPRGGPHRFGPFGNCLIYVMLLAFLLGHLKHAFRSSCIKIVCLVNMKVYTGHIIIEVTRKNYLTG